MSDTKKNDDTTDVPATSTTQPTDTPKRRKSMLGFGAIMKATSKFKVKLTKIRSESSKGVRRDQARVRRMSIAPPALIDNDETSRTKQQNLAKQAQKRKVDNKNNDNNNKSISNMNNNFNNNNDTIPTTNELRHTLKPMETLLDVLGEHSIRGIRKNETVDLSDPSYRISSDTLSEIHFMSAGGTDRRAMDTVTDMYLSYNHIDTLLPLAVVSPPRKTDNLPSSSKSSKSSKNENEKNNTRNASASSKPKEREIHAFQNLEIILADHNYIRWLCPGYRGQLNYHAWPYEMTSLIHLDLSYNRLDAIPDLICMPNLQVLNVAHNRIMSSSISNLDYGNRLQLLDLSENRLGWSPRAFINDLHSHFICCVQLRRLCLGGNPFITELPNYFKFVIQCYFSPTLHSGHGGVHGGVHGVHGVHGDNDSEINEEGSILITREEKEAARNLRRGFHASGRAGRNQHRRSQMNSSNNHDRYDRRLRLTSRSKKSSLNFIDGVQVSEQLIFECQNITLTEDQLCAQAIRMGVTDGYSEQERIQENDTSKSNGNDDSSSSLLSTEQKATLLSRSQLWTVTQEDYHNVPFDDLTLPRLEDVRLELRKCLVVPLHTRKMLRQIFTWIHLMVEAGEEEHADIVSRLGMSLKNVEKMLKKC